MRGASSTEPKQWLQVEAALAAKQKVEEAMAALRQAHRAELEAEKAHYEGLLQRARAAQVRVPNCKLMCWHALLCWQLLGTLKLCRREHDMVAPLKRHQLTASDALVAAQLASAAHIYKS